MTFVDCDFCGEQIRVSQVPEHQRLRIETGTCHPSWHHRLPEQFRDVRPADPNVPPQPSLAGGADPFIASIYNGRHGTALRRVG